MSKEIIIEFSGGIDSLYCAHFLAQEYDKVHLLTFDKGYLHFGLNMGKKNVNLLKKIHGHNKIIHKVINMKPLFKKMAVHSYRKTSSEFGNETAWCLPCRASMGIMSTLYALQNNIREFTDGANYEQAPDGEKIIATADNFPEFLNLVKSFAEHYKISYKPVVYDLNTREERRNALLEIGAKIDFNSMDRKKKSLFDIFNPSFYSRVQPICLSGYIIHWKRNIFNVREELTAEKVVASVEPKIRTIGHEFIKNQLREKT